MASKSNRVPTVVAVVMGKLPQPRRVKTRLCPPLSPEQAAGVHELFLRHTLERLVGLSLDGVFLTTLLAFDPPEAEDEALRLATEIRHVTLRPQTQGDLGQRLIDVHERGDRELTNLFLGADSPDLPDEHLRTAVHLLRQGGDIVLGPCDDGGFWCLGVAAGVDLRPILAGVAWSSGGEMEQVRRNAESGGLSVGLAPAWCDVDRPADLATLWDRLNSDPRGQPLAQRLLRLLPRHLLEPDAGRT